MRNVEFMSVGDEIVADLYLPDDLSKPVPAVVLAGGWCYVKELVQPTFAEQISASGMAAVVFDYRCLGQSGGEPRQRINPWDQIEDYKNAISFVSGLDEVDAERIGVWGISYSGGHVIQLAATDPRVKAMASVVPVIDGYQNLRLAHGTVGFRRLVAAISDDRSQRWVGESGGVLSHNPQSSEGLSTWPFPTSADMFWELKDSEAPNYVGHATTVSTEWLLEYDVMPYASRIVTPASMLVVAENDDHTHWDMALSAFAAIPAADKRLEIIKKSSHQGIYRDLDQRMVAARLCADWFALHLKT